MKKILLFVTAILLLGSGYAQKAPMTKLISSSEDRVVVNFQLNDFDFAKVQTPQGDQYIVNAPKMASMLIAGAPDLPMIPVPVIIGDHAEMIVNVIDAQYTDYPNMNIAPSKGNFSRKINPDDVPYTYGEMYQQDAFWPASQAYLESPYILRDFRGQNIMVRPFAYNPQTHTLRVYDNLTIEMTKVSDNGENQKVTRRSNTIKVDPEMGHAYSTRFINFGQSASKYTFIEDAGEMLVICPDQYMEAMQEFVDWKNESGRPTTMVSLSEVGGNNDTQIKNYISNIYNDPDRNLEFILLVGDYNDLTPHSMSGGRSDNWFGMLEGSNNDYYIEAFVGRFSVQSVNDVQTHVNKVLYYERDMPEGLTWLNTGIGVGANEGAGMGHMGGEADYVHVNYIRDTLLHYTYQTVTQQYSGVGGGTSANAISADVNNGATIINYCNHGSQQSWAVGNYSVSHVNALTNDYKLPFVWSVACNNGEFNGNCFGEAWLRATNNSNGAPTGAIGGMFSWISQPWTPPMTGQDEMVDILTEWKHSDQFNHTFGGVSLNGNEYILDMHPEDNGATHNTWILFGDPSLMVRTDNPVSMNVTVNPSVLMLGMSDLIVNAETAYGIATLSMNGEVIASGKIENNSTTLHFEPLNNVGLATLTVMGYNKVTYRGTIEIVPAEGPYLILDECNVQADNMLVTYGGEATAYPTIKNVGVEDVQNVNVTISTDCEYIQEIFNPIATISEVGAGEAVTMTDGFRFTVANNVPDQTLAEFNLEFSAGEQVWDGSFSVTLNAPALSLQNVNLSGAVAGETGTMILEFINNGHCASPATTLNLMSSSSNITLSETYFAHEAIQPGETASFTLQYTVAEGVEEGSCYEVNYVLNADHYTIDGATAVSIGNVAEDFETGNFEQFPWTFQGNANWTIDNTNAYEGSYCAKSGVIGNSQSTSMELTVNIPMDGQISFFKKVSSEYNYDKLHFFIDGVEKGNWSGNVNWSQESYEITAGNHVIKWTYDKDYSATSGSDCAWVDNIVMPANQVIIALDPVENLIAETNENTVMLSWDAKDRAVNYTIFRNGEELGTQEGIDFEEEVEHGTYTYTVVYRDSDGAISKPNYIVVDVISFLGVAESNSNFVVYPNPTDSQLNIQFNGNYSYTLFNSFGQQVMSGKASGSQQLNLSNLAKGIYLLQLNNGQQNNIQKVIVK
ncbi:MAG: T9SS type A sorting domain-containing protein [Bacteroidales bacterium]|nr:T9SS type A sorting domain-containing protein [Bacteroidales bacterium]